MINVADTGGIASDVILGQIQYIAEKVSSLVDITMFLVGLSIGALVVSIILKEVL